MRTRLLVGIATMMTIASSQSYAGESALDAAKKIAGKYTGKWSIYGIAGGSAVEKSSLSA